MHPQRIAIADGSPVMSARIATVASIVISIVVPVRSVDGLVLCSRALDDFNDLRPAR